jgi:hypothetical protein
LGGTDERAGLASNGLDWITGYSTLAASRTPSVLLLTLPSGRRKSTRFQLTRSGVAIMTDKLPSASLDVLDQRMNQLAREIAMTSRADPRRVELVNEMSRLNLLSAMLERKRMDA